jgi:formamidopyrimidine-DNA glycosylase
MPELPEVETICRYLRSGTVEYPSILGLRIQDAQILWRRSIAAPSPDLFQRQIGSRLIESINRRGKYLIINLDDGFYMLVHLRMSGDLWLESQSTRIANHHRVVFNLDNGMRLAFNDTRKFGRVWVTQNPLEVLSHLGPEPLDTALTREKFFLLLRARARQLKPLLLDQSFIAGLGNIYTDEALFEAGLHPLTISNRLNLEEAGRLLTSIRSTLKEGIRHNGASIDWVYRGGNFQNYFQVYQRNGETCKRCGSVILRMVVGQRGTHYCPKCQPEP